MIDTKTLQDLPYYQNLTEDEKSLLPTKTTIKTFKKGDIIHRSERECLGMSMVLKGEIRTYIMSEEGREVTLFRLFEGDACVTSASCVIGQLTFDTFMVAETDVTLLVVGAKFFSTLVNNNIYVKCFTYELLTERYSDVVWSFQQILFKRFDKRLASYLIEEYNITQNAEINRSHDEIAKQTSSAREVVTRMLKRFESAGLVKLNRRAVILTDINGLKKLL